MWHIFGWSPSDVFIKILALPVGSWTGSLGGWWSSRRAPFIKKKLTDHDNKGGHHDHGHDHDLDNDVGSNKDGVGEHINVAMGSEE